MCCVFISRECINDLMDQLRNEGAVGIQILLGSDSFIALLYIDDVINLADTVS